MKKYFKINNLDIACSKFTLYINCRNQIYVYIIHSLPFTPAPLVSFGMVTENTPAIYTTWCDISKSFAQESPTTPTPPQHAWTWSVT